MAQARIRPIVELTMSEREATDVTKAILEAAEDPDADTPALRVAKVLIQQLGLRVRAAEQQPIPGVRKPGARKGRVAPPEPAAEPEEAEEA